MRANFNQNVFKAVFNKVILKAVFNKTNDSRGSFCLNMQKKVILKAGFN